MLHHSEAEGMNCRHETKKPEKNPFAPWLFKTCTNSSRAVMGRKGEDEEAEAAAAAAAEEVEAARTPAAAAAADDGAEPADEETDGGFIAIVPEDEDATLEQVCTDADDEALDAAMDGTDEDDEADDDADALLKLDWIIERCASTSIGLAMVWISSTLMAALMPLRVDSGSVRLSALFL